MTVKCMGVLDSDLDFTIVNLFMITGGQVGQPLLGMWTVDGLRIYPKVKTAYFVKTKSGIDYIYLDDIL